jgi:hypothetical protein
MQISFGPVYLVWYASHIPGVLLFSWRDFLCLIVTATTSLLHQIAFFHLALEYGANYRPFISFDAVSSVDTYDCLQLCSCFHHETPHLYPNPTTT